MIAFFAVCAVMGAIDGSANPAPSAPKTQAADPAAATTPTVAPSPVAAPATTVTPAAAPSPTHTALTVAQKMYRWGHTGGGLAEVTTLDGDLSQIATTSGDEDAIGLHHACNRLRIDTENAQESPPAPLGSFRRQFEYALTDYARAASNCLEGTATESAFLIERSTSEMSTGTVHITRATAILHGLVPSG